MTDLNPRDLEQLSAYLDGELTARESGELERRLESDETLSAALSELRQTSDLLGTLPQVAAPRSFTLGPEHAPTPSGFPMLQFSAALAALSFVVVVGADLLGSAGGAMPLAAAPAEIAAQADLDLAREGQLEALGTEQAELGYFAAQPELDPGAAADLEAEADAALEPVAGAPPEEPSERTQSAAEDEFAETAPQDELANSADELAEAEAPLAMGESAAGEERASAEPEVAEKLDEPLLEPAPGRAISGEPAEPPGGPPIRILEAALAALAIGLTILAVARRQRA